MFTRRLFVDMGEDNAPPATLATLEFDINKSGGSSLSGAVITITYKGERQTKTADNKGLAVFYEIPRNTTINYTVTATGYNTSSGSLIIEGLDYYVETVEMEASIPPLPDVDTFLLDGFGPGTVTIKIPEGCNVVKVLYDVYHENEGFVEIDVLSVNTGVWWLEAYGYEGIAGDIYIGVTSGAGYTLSVMTDSETGTESGSISIEYSKSINTKTPNKTDYL